MAKRNKAKRLAAQQYIDGILSGDRIMLSRAITLIESQLEEDRRLSGEILAACLSHTGKAFRLGITGVPGVGKSTFIDSFGSLLTENELKVAVLAIDPTSQRSRGSILGDKTRMNRLALNPKAYVRPSPTGGSLGGVARKTREALLLCEAAGFELILVETVGVGQSEIAVHSMVDFFLLLMLPNAGDDLQGIKKGIMEMADALFINKADGTFLAKARIAQAQYAQAIRLFPMGDNGWKPKVLKGSALEENGLTELWQLLQEYRTKMEVQGHWVARREKQALQWMEDTIQEGLAQGFYQDPRVLLALPKIRQQVLSQELPPIQAAEQLLKLWEATKSSS